MKTILTAVFCHETNRQAPGLTDFQNYINCYAVYGEQAVRELLLKETVPAREAVRLAMESDRYPVIFAAPDPAKAGLTHVRQPIYPLDEV